MRGPEHSKSPSQLIDARIKELGDWRGEMLSRLRALVKDADPDVVEEWKWRGVPVWSHDGLICTGETYKTVVKMTFAKGARWRILRGSSTPVSTGTRGAPSTSTRATTIDEEALKALVRAAVALNMSKARR